MAYFFVCKELLVCHQFSWSTSSRQLTSHNVQLNNVKHLLARTGTWWQLVASQLLFNPFPNKPWFLRVCCTSLLKIPWEKEKLLVTSNFPQCFLPVWRTFFHFHQIWICCLQPLLVWNSLELAVWESVNNKIFKAVQIVSNCMGQNKSESRLNVCYRMSRKQGWKRRKCWLPWFSSFPVMFSKAFF